MWASCCGLLNEVMGTGTVRAQQPGFGAGAGPFRFAPSAGYSTYPPTASGSAGQLCKACGLAFSVFRRKHICCDCKKSFCALCSVLQEELWCCSTCHLLRSTAFQRPRLMQLRVKDLRQYLLLRNISTDTCREKEDLVDLGDVLSPSDSSGTSQEQEDTPTASLLNLEPTETLMEVSPLKEILARNFVNYSPAAARSGSCWSECNRLYRENEHNRKSNGVKAQLAADDNLCRICMDAIIDCVLLECGHMVTCTKCGKRMSECPICRQYVVRAVHVFKS
ncbi:hypothetical protein KUCAC02_008960 [Chaenocephalus aceratus]|uniref:Uncharacterized protein n=1 Tax=Chaenocephalus aceratus TaxID=36190 RepID=A0ACB9WSE0_CHAAC|nr:hypothetical protein KUCAC02_008960 [Chaenocephalus aceratus]